MIYKTVFKIYTTNMNWPMERGNLARTGSLGSVPSGHVDAEPGTALWRFDTDAYTPNPPTVVERTVLVPGMETLYAVDVTDGTEQWKRRCKPGPGEVVSDGDRVFAAVEGESGQFDTLTAFDLDSGKVLWKGTPVEGEMIGYATIYGSQIVVLSGEYDAYCLDKRTGNVEWSWTPNDRGMHSVDEEFVYIGDSSGTIYGLDRSNGATEWSLDLEVDRTPHPIVTGERIVCSCGSRGLVSIDRSSMEVCWRYGTVGLMRMPSIDDERIYMGNTNGRLVAVDRTDGEHAWKFRAEGQIEYPATTGETVYVPSNDSSVYSIDAASGTVNWTYDTGSDRVDSPAVASGRLFVAHDDHLTALAIESPGRDRDTRVWKLGEADYAAGYCPECGSDLTAYGQVNFCPDCGAQIPD